MGQIAVNYTSSPFISVYPWASGFGTKYSNPATLPASASNGLAFNKINTAIATSDSSSATLKVYPWSASTGFGTKYSDPPAGATSSNRFKFSSNKIAQAISVSPYVFVYPWSDATGFGTKYTNPAVYAGSRAVEWSQSGTELFVSGNFGPTVAAYSFSDSGFGTRYSDPATIPAGAVANINLNSMQNQLLLNVAVSPRFLVYEWNATTGWGARRTYSAFTSLSNTFDQTDTAIMSTISTANYIYALSWSNTTGFGSVYADPATVPTSSTQDVAASEGSMFFAHTSTPYISAYAWSGSTGWGARYSNPSSLPAGAAVRVAATNPVSAVATGAGVGIAIASAEGNAIGTIVAGGGGMLLLGVG